jgi:hypothetical protein
MVPKVRIALIAAVVAFTGCVNVTMSEREVLKDIEYFGLEEEEEYSQGMAMSLNFLPGVGNFYLGQVGYGVMNLLFWPVSILWGMPQAWIDADALNQKYTVDYYRTRAGMKRAEETLRQRQVPEDGWPYWLGQR